ncbi:hypothetical protein SLA2020_288890 [Shorea laevis]
MALASVSKSSTVYIDRSMGSDTSCMALASVSNHTLRPKTCPLTLTLAIQERRSLTSSIFSRKEGLSFDKSLRVSTSWILPKASLVSVQRAPSAELTPQLYVSLTDGEQRSPRIVGEMICRRLGQASPEVELSPL